MPDSPADQLTAAAKLLRDAATSAAPAPWSVNQWGHVDTAHDETVAEVWPLDQDDPNANATWIALAHPGIGLALAAWLESAAEDAELIGPDYRALAVARQVLGQVTE